MEQSVISRVVAVAPGRFAAGHLGELTQQVPFEMVDAVLAQSGGMQRRVRDLPSRVVVYLLLAGCLFAELGYWQVWQRLVAGLDGLAVPDPSQTALTKARRRVGGPWYRCGPCSNCCAARLPPPWPARCVGVDCWSARSTGPS